MYRVSTGDQKRSVGHTGDSLEVAVALAGPWSEMRGCDDHSCWRDSGGLQS